MDSIIIKLLDYLSQYNYTTAEELAKQLNVSRKTVRMRLKDLNDLLCPNGAELLSKHGFGYMIKINDSVKYLSFKKLRTEKQKYIPTTPMEREEYILLLLLNKDDFIKLEDLSETLYISKTTLSKEIKNIENTISYYNIEIERRPKYGIKIKGKEENIRSCLVKHYSNIVVKRWDEHDSEIIELGNYLLSVLNKHNINYSEVAFYYILTELYVSMKRIGFDHQLADNYDNITEKVNGDIMSVAKEIVMFIENKLKEELNVAELRYFAIQLAGMITIDEKEKFGDTVILEKTKNLVYLMLNQVFNGFNIDLTSNENLFKVLCQHMIPFDIRMKYGINIDNPILEEIKCKFFYAFFIASHACIPLKEYYKKDIPEPEIGYFAVIFALELEKKSTFLTKKRILLVCATGKNSSKLLAYECRRKFKEFIESIDVCNVYDVKNKDFSDIDYVFSTVPITQSIPVPIFEVNNFFDDMEIKRVKELFIKGKKSFLRCYYKENLFFGKVSCSDRNEIIRIMCNKISKVIELPQDFYHSVLRREEMVATDFGYKVAMPHPISVITRDTFASVVVLDKPIFWGRQEVEVVILLSISEEPDERLEHFYSSTSKFINDSTSVKKLIESPKYEVLMECLENQNSNDA